MSTHSSSNCKVTIENLSFSADKTDLFQIFSSRIKVRSIYIEYDRSGRSTGRAELTLWNEEDAFKLVREFNGASIDNKPIQLKQESLKRKPKFIDEDFERMLQEGK